MKFHYELNKDYCLISTHDNVVTATDIYNFTLDLVVVNPDVANTPNIWDLSNVEIVGDLNQLKELYLEMAAVISETVKVAFVTNNILTAAIAKYYSDLFRNHRYLHFETFKDMSKAKYWALDPKVK